MWIDFYGGSWTLRRISHRCLSAATRSDSRLQKSGFTSSRIARDVEMQLIMSSAGPMFRRTPAVLLGDSIACLYSDRQLEMGSCPLPAVPQSGGKSVDR